MSIFDYFTRRNHQTAVSVSPAEQPIPEEEQQYYRPESYYQQGRLDGKPVVTFQQRKATAYPSKRGLYPAEILLLAYCEYGTYPNPKNGYPGFWWFEYGIRNVGAVLRSLEERGFLRFVTKSGRDSRLVYTPTRDARVELEENRYVKFLHDYRNDFTITLWDVNRELHDNPQADWDEIINRYLDNQLSQCYRRDQIDLTGMDLRQKAQEIQRYMAMQQILSSSKAAGITRFTFLATLDLRTCPVCARRDLRPCTEHSAPPCHPGCRCTVIPYEAKQSRTGKIRYARDPITGKGMQVAGDMDYRKWHSRYVMGNAQAIANKEQIISERNRYPYQKTQILFTLSEHPGILQSELAEASGISKSTAMAILKKLVDEGTVVKERAGRSFSLHLK